MLEITTNDSVRTVTIDRPEVKNALSTELVAELADAIEEAEPETVDALVLTGAGDAFCSGGDIEAMRDRTETSLESFSRLQTTLTRLLEAIMSTPVPVIARVNGDAVGAGTNLAAACDFAVAAESARFGEVFVNVGLIPDAGGTVLLPRLVGLRTAKELAMTGELFDAERAASAGLVNRVVPDEELDREVETLLASLREKPGDILGLIKLGMHGNLGRSVSEGLEREALLQSLAYDSDAHETAVRRFLER